MLREANIPEEVIRSVRALGKSFDSTKDEQESEVAADDEMDGSIDDEEDSSDGMNVFTRRRLIVYDTNCH